MHDKFRVTNIAFDDQQRVTEITAVVHDNTRKTIDDMLDTSHITTTGRDGAHSTVTIPAAAAARLFIAAERSPLLERNQPHIMALHNGLAHIVYGLMGETYDAESAA